MSIAMQQQLARSISSKALARRAWLPGTRLAKSQGELCRKVEYFWMCLDNGLSSCPMRFLCI